MFTKRKSLVLAIVALLFSASSAGAVTCTITGQLLDATNAPIVNAVIQFNSVRQQTVAGVVIPATLVTTTTDPTGNIVGFALQQGLSGQFVICNPKAGGCGTPTPALIPVAGTAFFADILSGTAISAGNGTIGNLSVTGTSIFSGTMTFPDGSTYTTAGHNNMKAVGIGAPAPTITGNLLQITGNGNQPTNMALTNTGTGANANTTYYLGNGIPHYGAFQLTNPGFTAGGALVPADSMVVGTDAANGMLFNTANASSAFNWAVGGIKIASMSINAFEFTRDVNGGIELGIQNLNTGTGTQANLMARSNDHGFQFGQMGSGWTANPFFPPDSSIIETDGPQIFIGSYIPSTNINFNITGSIFGRFENTANQIQGLDLPGWASRTGLGGQVAGLTIGNSYFSATNWAGVSISGAAAYNQAAGQWIADGGAGSGVGLFNTYQGIHSFYYDGPHSAGQTVTWKLEAAIDGNALHVTHLDNNVNATPPAVTGGGGASLVSGSRDTSGEIFVPDASQDVSLGFFLPFIGNSECIAQDDGQYRMWVVFNKNTTTVSFRCQTAVGTRCAVGNGFVMYHCFGLS